MDDSNSVQTNYDEQAKSYSQFVSTPLGTLEKELFELCIKGCDGKKVLDLGGGTSSVDVIDISPEMMRHGQEYEKSIGRDRINWYQADWSAAVRHGHRERHLRTCALTDPPLVFQSTALEAHYSDSFEIPGQYFEDFQNVPFAETPVVAAHRGFWREYLESPILYIFTASKKA
ncbi:S-adenosyl-L-methionine-dependent methyltransferase [Apiospora saccharicola]|uniref:S-adenosyl-L-methionine-dependent methyltransferase n=1 Tax=Apiospora saccharicola TaxID=335842 RepID=A0ABR1UER3_9PEZI